MEMELSLQKSWLTFGLILTLGLINVLLIKQNLHLRQQLATGARTFDLTTNFLRAGDVVSAVTATGLDGRPYQLQYTKDGRHHLLLFFSANCPYCEQQAPLWRDLLNRVDSNRFAVLGVVSDKEQRGLVSAHADASGYFKTKTPLPIVFFDKDSLGTYKLNATPTTLLIDEAGTVEHAWVGKWDQASAMEVAAALR
jgi:peroxiredoxin